LQEKQATEVTDSNWKEFIGIDKYYPNYLDYFKGKIARDGVGKTVVKYALDETLLPSFVSGAVHPLIHTGFGLEFGQDIVVAEGLSEACVHKPAFAPVVDIQKYSIKSTSGKDILSIVKEVQKDPLFDDVVTFKDFPKSDPVLKNKKATDRIKEYVMQWKIVESEEGYAKAWTELFEFTTHSACSSAFPPPHITNDPKYKGKHLRPVLDFFLMYFPYISRANSRHTLTATFAARAVLPFVPLSQRALFLRVDFAVSLTYYISRGRPLIQPSKLPQTSESWQSLSEKVWKDEDLHVPKVVRALKTIAVDCGEMDETLARNAAALVVQEKVVNGREWSFLGHGFDEAWDKVAHETDDKVDSRM